MVQWFHGVIHKMCENLEYVYTSRLTQDDWPKTARGLTGDLPLLLLNHLADFAQKTFGGPWAPQTV